jgi:ABC-type amino acid transport substrate-binding protein
MGQIQQRGELVVGVKYDVPPFGYLNPATNQVEGFDADLGRELARTLFGNPNQVRFVEAISRDRIPFLKEDRVDVVLSTLTITDERKQEIDFSEPYYLAGQSILVPEGSPVHGVNDLNGRAVASLQGTTSERNLRRRAPNATLVLFPTSAPMLAALQDHQVDAVSTDDTILMGMIGRNPALHLVGGLFTEEPYGAGIKKGRPEFVAFVDQVFDQLKTNGRWAELYKQHVAPLSGSVPEPPL